MSTAPAPHPDINPARRRARIIVAITIALALLAAAVLLWLPFDPLEEPAPRLDKMLPVSVEAAIRFDGKDAWDSPFVQEAWARADMVQLRERFDFEGRVMAPLRRAEQVVHDITLGVADPPSIERDLIPAEVVLAVEGDELLCLTRISARARALEFLRRRDKDALRAEGVTVEGEFLRLERDGHALWVARRSDVLVLSTSRALALAALLCADRGGLNSLHARSDFNDALNLGARAKRRAYLWADSTMLARRLDRTVHVTDGTILEGAALPWWSEFLAATQHSIRAEIDLSARDKIALYARFPFELSRLPSTVAALDSPSAPAAAELERAAAAYSVSGETIVAGGTTAHAAQVLELLLRSMPPEHQVVADQALAQAGESTATLARTLSSHFDDGIGFLVARTLEASAIQKESDEPGAVHAIPATIVVFRLRDPVRGGDAVIAELRNRATLLFDANLATTDEELPGGARLFVVDRHGLGGQWELLAPAFAIDGERFLFSTHAEHLRRAIAASRRDHARAGAVARMLVMSLRVDPLRAFIDDQRFEAADRATFHDWAAERREIAAAHHDDPDRVDREVRARIARRRKVEIPAAIEDYRSRWRWLSVISAADCAAELKGGVLELRGSLLLE